MFSNGSNKDIRLMIVEDDLRIAEINRRFVEKVTGYEVVGIAANEKEAKELLTILHPDLVLLDLYFPDMNGFELLRFIRENLPDTDVIMITAAKEVESVKEAIRRGVYDFIIKPLVFERFQETLVRYESFFHKLKKWENEKSTIDQRDVDQLIHAGNKAMKETLLPKGIDRLTLEKVYSVIGQVAQGLTAEEVGKEIGASRTTARRYLEYLVSNGEAVADLVYGTVGRPERFYRTVKGTSVSSKS